MCPERIETIICFNAGFVNDEGGPLGIGIQVLVSNHLQVLSSKAMVLKRVRKRLKNQSGKCYGAERK